MIEVSCILATKDRPAFLTQAITCWQAQTARDQSELIIIDDGADTGAGLVPRLGNVKYVHLREDTLLGTKLNLGIALASGRIIQKIDDDDYYHPAFLAATRDALIASGREDAIVACGTFLVLLPGSPALRLAESGPWFAGGTLCFYRRAWMVRPFRDLPSAVDAGFLEEHADLLRIALQNPDLYVLVRHARNTWQRFPKPEAPPVTEYFASCPVYHKSLLDVVGPEHIAFYTGLAGSVSPESDRRLATP